MDLNQFLKDNAQALIAFVGVLIGLLFSFLSNSFQAREREKDREEQRRETRLSLARQLVMQDIAVVEEGVDNYLKTLDMMTIARAKKQEGIISEDEMRNVIRNSFFDEDGRLKKSSEHDYIALQLALALGKEYYDEYMKLGELSAGYTAFQMNDPRPLLELLETLNGMEYQLLTVAANLHNMLRQKLLAVGDEQSDRSKKPVGFVRLWQSIKNA